MRIKQIEVILTWEDGTPVVPDVKVAPDVATAAKIENGKSKLRTVKIQLGLSCNFECEYCNQRFVPHADSTNPDDVKPFVDNMSTWFDGGSDGKGSGTKIEFWGGEPLVYWKTLKPLAEELRNKYPNAIFGLITNGSLLDKEKNDWLEKLNFSVSVSHDGPGQFVRGPDPLDDPEQRERILGFYRMQTRLGKSFSFNAMLNSKNQSRKEIYDWFVNLTGDENVVLGEGSIVDAYDEEGIVNSLITKEEHFAFRQRAFGELYASEGKIGFMAQLGKIDDFTNSILNHREAKYLGQKCGMDDEHSLAIDLRGNVMTCQNVSPLEVSKNGESHHGGTLDDYDNVEIKTSTHWSNRKECSGCPVLHLCKGACMFLDKKFWDISCANAYSDNVALFCVAIASMTGYIPTLIKAEGLPLERQDIFGTVFEHKEDPKKKIIPIKVVSEKIGELDGVEVYGQAKLEV